MTKLKGQHFFYKKYYNNRPTQNRPGSLYNFGKSVVGTKISAHFIVPVPGSYHEGHLKNAISHTNSLFVKLSTYYAC